MKKKLLSVLALSMCFCMGMSTFASCGGDKDGDKGESQTSEQQGGNESGSGNGGNGGDQGGNGGETSLTQDQILAKLIEASDATLAYKGAYTMTMVGSEKDTTTSVNGNENWESTMSGIISVDAAAGKLFMVNTEKDVEDGITETEEMTVKYFTEGDKSYSYMKQTQTSTEEGQAPIEQDMYAEVSTYALKAAMEEYGLENSDYFDIASAGLSADISVDAYNAAYATIIADSKAAIALEANNEESDWYQVNADASLLISCAVVDGAYSVTTKITMSMSTPEYTRTGEQETIMTAKDGKIVSMRMKEKETETSYRVYIGEGEKDWEEVPAGTEGAIQVTESEDYSYIMSMNYAFAETEYNAVATTLPTDPSQIMPASNYFSKGVRAYINGVDWGREYLSGETAAEAVNGIGAPSNMNVVWYKDAACTQVIDETITMDEIFAMDAIYGKATAKEGYVIYTTERASVFGADVPDAYKLIYGNMMAGYNNISVAQVGEEEWNGINLYKESDNEVITVNGTVIEFEEDENSKYYPVVEGQTYTVKRTTTYMKADLNFFDRF